MDNIELTEFTKGESSSARADEINEFTKDESSSGRADEINEFTKDESGSGRADEIDEFTKGESGSARADEINEFTKGESSSARADEINESNFQIDMTQLHIGSVIAEGLSSSVHQGFYMGIPVAIKRIEREKGTDVSPGVKEKFQRQVRMLSKVQHENIVKFIGYTMDPALTIVTEFMRGGSLKDRLWNSQPTSLQIVKPNGLYIKDILTIALGISRAMEHLHANGIIHRNLKPSNIFLTADKKTAKVGDFGLCREEEGGDLTPEAGSHPWIAPEVFNMEIYWHRHTNWKLRDELRQWRPNYNHKVDVFSFAFILWEMITNDPPFKRMDDFWKGCIVKAQTRPSLNMIMTDLHPLLTSCWADDPEERPEFQQVSQTLLLVLNSIISRARATRQRKKRKSLLGKIRKCLHLRVEDEDDEDDD